METVWVEKYRPKTFDAIKGQQDIVLRAKAFVQKKNMPHLLFAGPPGVGKSTLALVIARELYGENWRENFFELNASDERGIDVVRIKVKDFARTKAIGDVPFKIIFLDEADALTKEAQQALRRTMENYTSSTRFILSCNYSTKIIDPIQSRCTLFRFKPLPKEELFGLIDEIAKRENVTLSPQAKEVLYEASAGDCRKMENMLQACAALTNKIDEETARSVASVAKPKEIRELLLLAVQGKFLEARKKLLSTMLTYGLSGEDVIKQIYQEILVLEIDARKKAAMIEKCAETEFRINEGSDPYLQIEALLASLAL
ncbi:MAG: replication factor C small subunit [Candidatus Woesearchaeota archaeon]